MPHLVDSSAVIPASRTRVAIQIPPPSTVAASFLSALPAARGRHHPASKRSPCRGARRATPEPAVATPRRQARHCVTPSIPRVCDGTSGTGAEEAISRQDSGGQRVAGFQHPVCSPAVRVGPPGSPASLRPRPSRPGVAAARARGWERVQVPRRSEGCKIVGPVMPHRAPSEPEPLPASASPQQGAKIARARAPSCTDLRASISQRGVWAAVHYPPPQQAGRQAGRGAS